jgi:hypothetical protein
MRVGFSDKLSDLIELERCNVGLDHIWPVPPVAPGLDVPGFDAGITPRSRREFHPSGRQCLCAFAGRIVAKRGADFQPKSLPCNQKLHALFGGARA